MSINRERRKRWVDSFVLIYGKYMCVMRGCSQAYYYLYIIIARFLIVGGLLEKNYCFQGLGRKNTRVA